MCEMNNLNLLGQGPNVGVTWFSLLGIALIAFVIWAVISAIVAILGKGGGWAILGIIAMFVLAVPAVMMVVALFTYQARRVDPARPVPAVETRGDHPLAVRIDDQHAEAVRVFHETHRKIDHSRHSVERDIKSIRQAQSVMLNEDRDAVAVVRLTLDPAALAEHKVSTSQLADAIATFSELVALGDGDGPVKLSELRRIRLAGSDDDPLPLGAVVEDLSRKTNLEADAAGPRVVRITGLSSQGSGAANVDDLAYELVWFDERVESAIQGTFTQEVSGDTVRLQVYQRESLTDNEQQRADAESKNILAALLPEETLSPDDTPDEAVAEAPQATDTAAASSAEAPVAAVAETKVDDNKSEEPASAETDKTDVAALAAETTEGEVAAAADEEKPQPATAAEVSPEVVASTDADVAANSTDDSKVATDDSTEGSDQTAVVAPPAATVPDASDDGDEVEELADAVAAPRAAEPAAPPAAPPVVARPAPPPAPAVVAVEPARPDAPVELSLPVEVDTSNERPAWVDDKDQLKNDGIYRVTVAAGPYQTRLECQLALDDEIIKATKEYLDHLQPHVGNFDVLDRAYLRSNLVKQLWEERHDTSVGPMRTIYARLEFTPGVQQHLQAITRERLVNERLKVTGAVSAAVLALLGTLFGYFKLDTLTKGYYSTRLKLLTGVVILGLLGVLRALTWSA